MDKDKLCVFTGDWMFAESLHWTTFDKLTPGNSTKLKYTIKSAIAKTFWYTPIDLTIVYTVQKCTEYSKVKLAMPNPDLITFCLMKN